MWNKCLIFDSNCQKNCTLSTILLYLILLAASFAVRLYVLDLGSSIFTQCLTLILECEIFISYAWKVPRDGN